MTVADQTSRPDAPNRPRWRELGLHSDVTLTQLMRDGYAEHASSVKHYRSAERPHRATLGEIDERGRRLASALHTLGLRPGDPLAVQLPNWVENDIAIRAAMQLGLTILPIVSVYGAHELSFILRESRAKALIVPETFRGFGVAERLAGLSGLPDLDHVIVVDGRAGDSSVPFDVLVERGSPDAPEPPIDADDVCALVYTSGTTASPKGVQHTHNTLLAERKGMGPVAGRPPGLTSVDTAPALHLFPAGHIAGVLGSIFMYASSSTIVTLDSFDRSDVVRAIAEFELTTSSGPPVFLAGILDAIDAGATEFATLRSFLVGAASVPASLVERADARGIRAFRCYGSSEHPTVSSGSPADPLWIRAETDGHVLAGNEVRIVDDDGRPVAEGAEGEICTLGPELFVGYRDPALDGDAFLPGGWYRTGDLGRLDGDLLTVTDRKKDIIIRGGENVSAKEVEDVLVRHDAVAEVAVVAAPHERLGEQVCAYVVVRPGAVIDQQEVGRHFLDQRVAKQKVPERVEVVEELPRTASGKVSKARLRELARGD